MTKSEKSTSSTGKRRLPAPDEAFQLYAEMGNKRSLRRLREACYAEGYRKPALVTLAKWCKTGSWVTWAKEFDANVTTLALQDAASEAAIERTKLAAKFGEIGGLALDKAREMLKGLDISTVSAADLKAVVSAAVELIKQYDLMTGGIPAETGVGSPDAAHPPAQSSEAMDLLSRTMEGIAQRIERAEATTPISKKTGH